MRGRRRDHVGTAILPSLDRTKTRDLVIWRSRSRNSNNSLKLACIRYRQTQLFFLRRRQITWSNTRHNSQAQIFKIQEQHESNTDVRPVSVKIPARLTPRGPKPRGFRWPDLVHFPKRGGRFQIHLNCELSLARRPQVFTFSTLPHKTTMSLTRTTCLVTRNWKAGASFKVPSPYLSEI